MRARILSFTDRGEALGDRLAEKLGATMSRCNRPLSLDQWTREGFAEDQALIYVGAAGIAVRAIAPYLQGKDRDPAVVVVDEGGRYAVPVLSGHLGGANDLARKISSLIGAEAVITTATDGRGVFAVDAWARCQGAWVSEPKKIKKLSAAVLAGETLRVKSAWEIQGTPPPGVRVVTEGPADLFLTLRQTGGEGLALVPRILTLGVGCKKGTTAEALETAFFSLCKEQGLYPEAVEAVATIDRKAEEGGLLSLCQRRGLPLLTFSPEELRGTEGEFSASAFVEETVGVDNVCERSAVRGSGGTLLVPKQAGDGITMAVAIRPFFPDWRMAEGGGKLYLVGLGPGVRASRTPAAEAALRRAEAICGYTAYLSLLKDSFPGKEWFSTPMKEELRRCAWAVEQAAAGRTVAMVCSGDAGIYGMAGPVLARAEGTRVEVEIVPGITAAVSGAALLGAPLMNDFCVISLSDLLTPWEEVERRLKCAAEADLVTVLYNPRSRHRPEHLRRACEILLKKKPGETVCGWVRNVGREGEEAHVTDLRNLRDAPLDMFCTAFVGSSRTVRSGKWMVTLRGYREPI